MSWKSVGNALKKVAGVAAPIVGGALLGPAGAALGGAVSGALRGGGVKGAVTGAAMGAISGGALNKAGAVGRAAGALKNVTTSRIPGLPSIAALPGTAAKNAGMAAIQQGLANATAKQGGLMGRIRGALATVTGNPDTLRTVVGAAGTGLGALQDQRQFDATRRQRQQQIDDDILTATQNRAKTAQQMQAEADELRRVRAQDQMFSPQRQAIVASLMSRLGMGGGMS